MDELLDELKLLLKTALTTKFTSYYKGNALILGKSYLPALMIYGNSTTVEAKTTASDTYTYNITIKAVTNVMKYVDEDGTGEIIKAQEDLYRLMEDRNSSNQPTATSVLGVLRKTSNIGGTRYKFNNNISIEYGEIQTGEFFYSAAIMTLDLATDLIQRPS